MQQLLVILFFVICALSDSAVYLRTSLNTGSTYSVDVIGVSGRTVATITIKAGAISRPDYLAVFPTPKSSLPLLDIWDDSIDVGIHSTPFLATLENTSILSSASPAEIQLLVSANVKDNPEWFQIGRVNTTSGEWNLLGPVNVDPSGETVTFQTTRLGTFAVLLTNEKGLQEITDLGVIATPSPQPTVIKISWDKAWVVPVASVMGIILCICIPGITYLTIKIRRRSKLIKKGKEEGNVLAYRTTTKEIPTLTPIINDGKTESNYLRRPNQAPESGRRKSVWEVGYWTGEEDDKV